MSEYQDHEMGWDDPLTKDNDDFSIAPEGDYEFEVTYLKRGRHEPKPGSGGKLPPCPKAELTLRVVANGETVSVKHNLFLHTKCEGLTSAFFRAIGQKKHGENLRPEWNDVVTSRGRCHLGIRTWKGTDGTEKKANQVTKFYDYDPSKMSHGDASFDFGGDDF